MASQRTTMFISHKHDDLKGIIGFLETNYNIKTYIDSRNSRMPLHKYQGYKYCFFKVLFSRIIAPLYLIMIFSIIIGYIFLK